MGNGKGTSPPRPALRLGIKLQLLALSAVALGGCGKQQANRPRYGGLSVITAEEIAQTSAIDAYNAVRLLRSYWLRPRAAPSLSDPGSMYSEVYVDNVPLSGGLNDLRIVAVGDIREIHYISPIDATTRFGTGHSGGVIMVMTRRGGG